MSSSGYFKEFCFLFLNSFCKRKEKLPTFKLGKNGKFVVNEIFINNNFDVKP